MLAEAYDLAQDGDCDGALSLYDAVISHEPSNVTALIDKGVTLQNMGRLRLAIRSCDRA